MKITDVEAIILRQPALNDGIADGSQDDLVIKIRTDEGIVGIGEVDSAPEAVKALVDRDSSHAIAGSLKDLLVGEDPTDVERLWQKMYRGLIYIGRRGIALHALSGIDIALWDIKGKAAGKPVHELLGGAKRDKVRAYASMLMPDTTEETTERVGKLREDGFTAVKLGWGLLGQDEDTDVALAAAAKDAAGDGVEIMIDSGLGYGADAKRAIEVGRAYEELGIFWFEEPFEPDEYEAYAELADTVEIRVAAGEQDTTLWGFRELIERGHVDLVQPDVTRCGGITELLRIADYARGKGVETVPHAWKSGIIKAASLQCNAVMPDALFQEYCIADTPINQTLTQERLPIDADGMLTVPTAPGIGVTLDDEVVERYRVH
ncbi:MAG: mandelate racemase/muconate lactonizing enzyme family protein [Solirubrobacteraceae bacterium]